MVAAAKTARMTKSTPMTALDNATQRIEDELWDREQLALFLKVAVRTVDQWRQDQVSGTPPFIMVGRRVRYSRLAIQEWIKQRSHQN
jgi:predicted DNA-binding transcriptional regulator AlpA